MKDPLSESSGQRQIMDADIPLGSPAAASTSRWTRLVIVLSVVAVLVGAVGLFFLKPAYQAFAVTVAFCMVATLLPPVLYYLFVWTRRTNLLNEFIGNLFQLGLVSRDGPNDDAGRMQMAISSYLEKFEDVYGPLAQKESFVQSIIRMPTPGTHRQNVRIAVRSSGFRQWFPMAVALPLALSTALVAIGWLVALALPEMWSAANGGTDASLLDWLNLDNPTVAGFAFLGAYFASLELLFRRYVRGDLGATAYVAVSHRIVLGVIGAWVVSMAIDLLPDMASDPTAGNRALAQSKAISAFLVGALPPLVWQYLVALFQRVTFATSLIPSLTSSLPLNGLDGLSIWHRARLEEEDIDSIPNLASAPLVDLLLRTRFPPERLVDWVDQAILYTCLGEQRDGPTTTVLRQQGIRTASGLLTVFGGARRRAEGGEGGGATVALSPERADSLVKALRIYPNLELVWCWRGLNDGKPFERCFEA